MSSEKLKYFGIGTKFYVEYEHDGVIESQKCILAKTFEDNFLFQVITIEVYHSGEVEGYISKQFDNNNTEMRNFCTLCFLQSELEKKVFPNIKKMEIIYSGKSV